MLSLPISNRFRTLAMLVLLACPAACNDDDDCGTAPPLEALFDLRLEAGNAWMYSGESAATVENMGGTSTYASVDLRVLYLEKAESFAGRDAFLVRSYLMSESVTTEPALAANSFYLGEDLDGLYRADPADGIWKNVLLFEESSFADSAFLLAGGPVHADGTTLGDSSIVVTAGSFETLLAEHRYPGIGPGKADDVGEIRQEHHADGVGLVYAGWDYSFDDDDPEGTDITARGFAGLVEAPGGPTLPYLVCEQEPNDGLGPELAQRLKPFAVTSGTVHITDPGAVVTDAEFGCLDFVCVYPNIDEVKKLEDWYFVDVVEDAQYRIDLVFEFATGVDGALNDLDLYIFEEETDGTVLFSARADASAGKAEWAIYPVMPAGRYHLAVQAWDTPAGAVPYSLSMRRQAVPVAAKNVAVKSAASGVLTSSGK